MVEPALTRQQAADRLAISERHLRKLEALHSIPVLRAGRAIRYDDLALRTLQEALRCPSKSPAAKDRALGKSPVPSMDSAYEKALKLLTPPSPTRCASKGKGNFTVLRFTGQRR